MTNEFKQHIKQLCPTMNDTWINAVFDDSAERSHNESFFHMDQIAILRAMAIHYLKHGNGLISKSFRGEYLCIDDNEDYDAFLTAQEKSGAWMTDIELTALGELFDVSIVVTSSNSTRKDHTFALYNAGENKPILHFNNINNTHWEYVNFAGKTVQTPGDGNCGYHAFAYGLQEMIGKKSELKLNNQSTITQNHENTSNSSTLKTETINIKNKIQNDEITAISQQKSLWEIVSTLPDKQALEETNKREMERIAKLDVDIQKQIANDYKYALNLALQDSMNYSGRSLFHTLTTELHEETLKKITQQVQEEKNISDITLHQ